MNTKKLISLLWLTFTFVIYTPSYGADQTLTQAASSVLQTGRLQTVKTNPKLYHFISEHLIPTAAPTSQYRDALDYRDGTGGRIQSLDMTNTIFLNILQELYFYMSMLDEEPTIPTKTTKVALIHRATMTQYRMDTTLDIPSDTAGLKRYFHDALALVYFDYAQSLCMDRKYDQAKDCLLKAKRFKHPHVLSQLSELHRCGLITLTLDEQKMVPLHLESVFYILCELNNWPFPLRKSGFRFSYSRPTLEINENTRLDNGLFTQKISNRSRLLCPCIWIRPLDGLEAKDCSLDNENGTIETYFLILGKRLIAASQSPKTLIIRGGHLTTDQTLKEPEITRKP